MAVTLHLPMEEMALVPYKTIEKEHCTGYN
jgi:hypothetical protein